MNKFELLSHPTDIKLKVFGSDKEDLFLKAMLSMFEAARYESEGKEVERIIEISSADLPSLLVDFLSEVIYLVEVNKEVYHNIAFKEFSDSSLKAVLKGRELKRMGVLIKSVTYHDLKVRQKKDGSFEATILFDI